MTVPRDQIVNRLREAGYRFHRKADRVEFYRRPGDIRRVSIPRRDLIPEPIACAILHQAGLTHEQIAQFLKDAVC
jgi:hypothetical protein